MASYRLPRREDMIIKPSRCTSCEHRLGILDLIPIISWFLSGGKCRHCKKKVSFRYPLIEIIMAALFVLIYYEYQLLPLAFVFYALNVVFVIMITIDFEHKIIPDEIQILLLIIGAAYCYVLDFGFYHWGYGALFGFALAFTLRWVFFIWKKKEALGFGDVKFFAVAGIFLGFYSFPPFLFLSGIIGVLTALIWRAAGKGEEFPFGPALSVSVYLCILYPKIFVDDVIKLLQWGYF